MSVEADIGSGLPAFTIVGLADTAVQEARERVRSALVNSNLEFPLKRITVNLAPADLRKAGPGFDLALATALLVASEQLPAESIAGHAFCGELGLDGSLRSVRGVLAVAEAARRSGIRKLVVPDCNAAEAALVEGIEVAGLTRLGQLLSAGESGLPTVDPPERSPLLSETDDAEQDMAQVRGHRAAKRGLEVAAAGGHNLLMIGPPGAGKSMLAARVPSILPPLTFAQALDTTRVHSVAGLLGGNSLVTRRPCRAPHHSISAPGLVGGGSGPSPGEISLAHNGVLFLDELSEFSRPALEALRQPLEEGVVRITRSQRSAVFPARVMLIAATNPCPCGNRGSIRAICSCHPSAIARYESKLSGPLLDRFDIMLRLESPSGEQLAEAERGPDSSEMRRCVASARTAQHRRLADHAITCNAEMGAGLLSRLVDLSPDAGELLLRSVDRIGLSLRGHDRALRVACTIADLEGSSVVERQHMSEALAYRDFRHVRVAAAA